MMRPQGLGLLCAGLLLSWLQGHADSESRQLEFNVLLDGKAIGTHRYELSRQGESLQVRSQADFSVKLFLFEAWSYRHENRELWIDNCLQRLESTTITNGKEQSVKAVRRDQGLWVVRENGRELLPGCVMSFAYWSKEFLESDALLNAQTGQLVPVEVRELGPDRVGAGERPATRYSLEGEDLSMELWYGSNEEWLALQSRTPEGRVLRYERR